MKSLWEWSLFYAAFWEFTRWYGLGKSVLIMLWCWILQKFGHLHKEVRFLNFLTNKDIDELIPRQPDKILNTTKLSAKQRNSERVAMMKKGCSLKTHKLKFSTLRELQYNLTNDLGLDAIRFKCFSIHSVR